MQLFGADATIFLHQKTLKKTVLKSSILMAVLIFFSLHPRLPKTSQNSKFINHIRNEAQDTSVYLLLCGRDAKIDIFLTKNRFVVKYKHDI